MQSLERALSVFQGQRPDRVPVIPIVGQAAARLNGMSIKEELRSPETLAESRLACLERFGYDGLYISADTWVTAEAMGAPVSQESDSPAQGSKPLLKKKDLTRLKPLDPRKEGRIPLLVQAVRKAALLCRGRFAVIGNFDQSPFSLACALRGINNLMADIMDSPSFVEALLDICTESVIRYAHAMAQAGATILNTGDSPAVLTGPQHYERYALKYERIVFEELKSLGLPLTLHICGDTGSLLELMGKSGAQGLELDFQVDLAQARKHLPQELTIIGNIDPVSVLLKGSTETVKKAVSGLLEAQEHLGRFILSSGCALAPGTPAENIEALVKAAQDFPGT
ncbi:Uroporphyrinogen decarboxylase [subsurface metagenome]